MLPKDIPQENVVNLNGSAIKAQDVLNTLGSQNPFVTIFLLDCCRTYYLRSPNIDARGVPVSTDFKPMEKAGSLIAFACAAGTQADDGNGQGNGLFTKHLLKHITTPNEDITLILRDVRRGVMEESQQKQIPFVSDCLLVRNVFLNGESGGK